MCYFKSADSSSCYFFLLKLFVSGTFNLKNGFVDNSLLDFDQRNKAFIIEEISVLSGKVVRKTISIL